MSGRKHVKELILHCWYGAQKSANSQFLVKKKITPKNRQNIPQHESQARVSSCFQKLGLTLICGNSHGDIHDYWIDHEILRVTTKPMQILPGSMGTYLIQRDQIAGYSVHIIASVLSP